MTVNTGGRMRGFIGRWLMRIQAVQGIVNMVSMSITAASTLTFALQSLGYTQVAPYVLGVGLIATPAFAYGYTEFGLFNRKNRENVDRGNNFATPRDVIDDTLIGVAEFAARHGRKPTKEERQIIEESVREQWQEFRDGVELEQ